MKNIVKSLVGALFITSFLFGQARAADTLAQDLPASSSPLPAGSCLYVAEWNGSVFNSSSRCSGWAAWLGAVPLNGNAGTPSAINLAGATNLPNSALQSGAAVANLGFTPVNPTRAINTGAGLAGGGNLTADRTIAMASMPGLTLKGNATGSSAAPTDIPLGANMSIVAGALTAAGGSGTPPGVNLDLITNNLGAFGSLTPGANVRNFLTTPALGIPSSWLQAGVAVANLGFTPPANTVTLTGTGRIAGGGSLAANRTFDLATIPSNTILGNPTGIAAIPTSMSLPTCDDVSGQHWNYTGGTIFCGTSGDGAGAGSAIDVTDGVNTVTDVSGMTFDQKVFAVSGSAGAVVITATTTVGTDRSGGDYTLDPADANTIVPVGAGHTYTFGQAGTTGFGTGWGPCLTNISTSGDATVTTTTSLFQGAGGATSFLLPAQASACMTSKLGNYVTQLNLSNTLPSSVNWSGSIFPTALSGNVNDYNPAGASTKVELHIDGGASDRNITGLGAGTSGRILAIRNNGATNNLVLVKDSASSSAANRFDMTQDVTLPPKGVRLFRYEAGSVNRWQPFGTILANSGVTAASYTCTNLTVGLDGRISTASNGSCSGGGSGITKAFAPIGWVAAVNPDKAVIMTATTAMTVTAIRGRVATAVGAAATAVVNKAASGTACSGGTAQNTGSFDANGTAATNQTLPLAGSGANSLVAGDSLCLVTTGGANWTGGVGNGGITVEYTVP